MLDDLPPPTCGHPAQQEQSQSKIVFQKGQFGVPSGCSLGIHCGVREGRMNATNAATTPASTKVKTKRKRRSRNALIEARERMALEANLEVVGTPSRAFIPALAELLADLIIEKASAGEYEIEGLRACGIGVTRQNESHEEEGTRTPALSGAATQEDNNGEGTTSGTVRVAQTRQGGRPSADGVAPQAEAG